MNLGIGRCALARPGRWCGARVRHTTSRTVGANPTTVHSFLPQATSTLRKDKVNGRFVGKVMPNAKLDIGLPITWSALHFAPRRKKHGGILLCRGWRGLLRCGHIHCCPRPSMHTERGSSAHAIIGGKI